MRITFVSAVAAAVSMAPCARAGENEGAWQEPGPITLAPMTGLSFRAQPEAAAPPELIAPAQREVPRFGEKGSEWWTIGAGYANNFDNDSDFNLLRVAYSQFLVEDVEFSVEANAWLFNQDGPNAAGFNPALLVRWHFHNEGPWSVYGDLGIGVLFATDQVPAGGTSFNLMPRAGVGFTREIGDAGARIQAGLRWHHVSNARIVGDTRNPSRDAPMLYAAVVFPF